MKKDFFDIMLKIMDQNPDIYLLFVGLGWPRYDEFKKKFGIRAINTEAAEQTALDIAVGLSYSNKIPFVYTITPFLLRGFETIRTYINHEELHIVLVGAGRDDDYSKHDGYSHDAKDIKKIFGTQENIIQTYPDSKEILEIAIQSAVIHNGPYFISLRR